MSQYRPFTHHIKNILTKKQEQTLQTVHRIGSSFLDKSSKSLVWRTQSEISKYSNLSKASVSNYLPELVRQGVVKGEIRVDETGRLTPYYIYTGKCYEIIGKICENEIKEIRKKDGTHQYAFAPKEGSKQPSAIPAARLEVDDNGIFVQWGVSKRGKPRRKNEMELTKKTETRYFVADKK